MCFPSTSEAEYVALEDPVKEFFKTFLAFYVAW